MKIDLILFTIDLKADRWLWDFRHHWKRYVKRHIPSLAMTCDWCGDTIDAVQLRHGPAWIAGCLCCAETLGRGWLEYGDTEADALANWRRTGGAEFRGMSHIHSVPKWARMKP